MRFRATVANLLATILMAVSCAASACSVKCDLHRVSPSCHAVAHRQNHMMDSMGETLSASSGAHGAPTHAMTAPCEQHVCVERPALMTPASDTAVHLESIQQARIVALIDRPAANSSPDWPSDPPPLRKSTLVSLHIVLRV